ncbi:lipopolysaccharide biosynthesis protein [Pedobacter sp. HMF7647]|uniref:Lipopolysaccharide biosynthesis protein n=1 Tax=Hufsiella arboris TaxID=2695275 RepID=A0A7K1YAT2_9SPHI|nr:Wzz/FepE/Etk N-terminal domain-containing protein [Hufsiella arboris]MXV51697.1 lipopolysaccharide biosynthesis protein [Hufsiella arboris]
MTELSTNQNVSADDEISLKELILKIREWYRYLLSKWKAILIAGIIGGILGFTYAYFKKPVYTADCTFVLEEGNAGGGLGQYAGLASMVGIDMGGAGNSGIFQGDNILELYKSRSMVQKALLTAADFNGKSQLLVDRYIQINKIREGWVEKPELKSLRFDNTPPENFSRLQDSILGNIVADINKNYLDVSKPDKKLSIIKVEVKAKDELFAKNFNDAIVKDVNDFYVQTKTKKSLENLAILQHQTDSVRRALNGAISGVASSMDANPNANLALRILQVPSQRRQVDAEANKAILTQLVQNLEISKVSLRKDAPLIQVVDEPILPLKEEKIGKLKGLVIGGFLLSLLVTFYLLFRKILAGIMD